ncbi:winged helix domain-containing protein [Marivita sp.]|uniref:winged helix domain-containing protein n=1 Tax=Marivita sp. TaxID=2003365 RepID=UPI003B52786B
MKIEVTLLSEPSRTFELDGRLGWTMTQLSIAGAKSVASIECPAPRWSAYVHKLRQRGVQIDTEMEPHHGTYPGQHARYKLACHVQIKALGAEV